MSDIQAQNAVQFFSYAFIFLSYYNNSFLSIDLLLVHETLV